MAITVSHTKTNNIADWTQADLDAQIRLGNFPVGTVLADIVLPSDWNGTHTVTGAVAKSGDTMTGVLAISTLTASTALVSDASKNIISSATTATELGYVSGVTSAIQTQLETIQTQSIIWALAY